MNTNQENERILALLHLYLTRAPHCITKEDVSDIADSCGVSEEEAFSLLLAAAFGLESDGKDRGFYMRYFPEMMHLQNAEAFQENPYYKNISFHESIEGSCKLSNFVYAPCEGFVCDDFVCKDDGRIIPQIGFFMEEFAYPAICEGDQIWMSITPNEINTMKDPVENALGRVLTYGLGLGYFAYMVSQKETVESVTVVEMNQNVIDLFTKYLLPKFEHPEKICVIHGDALKFAENSWEKGAYDVVFADLWHDVSDGLPLYQKLKALEYKRPECRYYYWIEKTMKAYI